MASVARVTPTGDVPSDGGSDGEPVGDGDVAKRLYLALRAEDLDTSARCIAEASDDELLARSAWEQRQDRPPSWLPGEAEANYATHGLTVVHVLARDCYDVNLVRQVVTRAPQALSESAGTDFSGREAQWLPMHVAAMGNRSAEVVSLLLTVGGLKQLQAKDVDGMSPMHMAAMLNNSAEVVELLLKVGGAEQLQVKDTNGVLPIHVAAMLNSSAEVVQHLLKVGGPEQLQAKVDGMLPIHFAAGLNSSAAVVQHLLKVGGVEQLQAKGDGSLLPIHMAAMGSSSVDVVQLLLKVGGPEQLQMEAKGGMPIHAAAMKNSSVEVVRVLLGRGSPRPASTSPEQCAVSSAIGRSREDIAELLIEAGVYTSLDEVPLPVLQEIPQRLREAVARVSVSSVLSSYFSDNVSPLGAAVRSPSSRTVV